MKTALVIGTGPAGLMAAEALADQGVSVTMAEAKPSVGRKFLMAGKSGLNLTKDEPFEVFLSAYGAAAQRLTPALTAFTNTDVCDWARDLGHEVFTGSSGRVFPKTMKTSPLLRAWLARLRDKGVTLKTRWRWLGWEGAQPVFETPEGKTSANVSVTILALGGASWSRLGSDGAWADILGKEGVPVTPFKAANMGLRITWSVHMSRHFGKPVKACALVVNAKAYRGEFVITKNGVEGGGIYTISQPVRDGAALSLDVTPDISLAKVQQRLTNPRGKTSLSNHLRKSLNLDPVRIALLQEFAHPLPAEPEPQAALIKNLPVRHAGPAPIDEAISTAGGVPFEELDDNLMLRKLPGVFVAGEMLDWEAPTGGYLITACLATGRQAGLAAARYLSEQE
jgi:uncharacterized flavoprotein (TIGR03862 family)